MVVYSLQNNISCKKSLSSAVCVYIPLPALPYLEVLVWSQDPFNFSMIEGERGPEMVKFLKDRGKNSHTPNDESVGSHLFNLDFLLLNWLLSCLNRICQSAVD